VEERSQPASSTHDRLQRPQARPVPLADIRFDEDRRIPTSSSEFSRVLGGGIVPGAVTLIGGDPGIGKSTLMLQEAAALARPEFPVLYVSGEESARQTKMRADRLELSSSDLLILAETNIDVILEEVERTSAKLVIIDSIQTVYSPELQSPPGSVSQVRESALQFMTLAKGSNLPVFLIGHVTKDGYLAGPKLLEHMVDTLLYFEGDRDHFYRILRAVKNRFGSTREIGVFQMTEGGLREVTNPSEIFLSQRRENVSGSAVVCTLEGTRPFLVEVQALVTPTNYGMPQRTAAGFDGRRLSLLLAVLEKRVGLRLSTADVFVNVAGGVRLTEPAADLGLCVAVASSLRNEIVDPKAMVVGEVGLGGEVRAVPQLDKRLAEAEKLGFRRAVVPRSVKMPASSRGALELIAVDRVEAALEAVVA
jgi:DNA repair protein RadA/Sms